MNGEELQEQVEWWRDMMTSLTALVDSHYLLISQISDSQRLRQVQTELHNMGAEWDTGWRSTNHQLAERAEAAEAELARARQTLTEIREFASKQRGSGPAWAIADMARTFLLGES